MKMFAVNVTAYIPYPITREYTETATGMPTAVARAIRKYRADARVKRKRIDQMVVKIGVASL